MLKLFLAFTLVPALEIFLFVRLGGAIGLFNTFLVVILTGIVGAGLARWQGAETMFRIRQSLNQGVTPAEEMIDAGLIFVAGMVLLTPGFMTDTLGLLLLWPPSRRRFKIFLRRKFDQWKDSGQINVVLETDYPKGFTEPSILKQVEDLQAWLAEQPSVAAFAQ